MQTAYDYMTSRCNPCLTDKVLGYFSRTGHTPFRRQGLEDCRSELPRIQTADEVLGYLRGKEGLNILEGQYISNRHGLKIPSLDKIYLIFAVRSWGLLEQTTMDSDYQGREGLYVLKG